MNRPPSRLGPYRIEKKIGAGGMGDVYRAYDRRLGRRVAIKHIRPQAAADPAIRLRLRREARAVAALNHPAIVQIYDFLETAEGEWIIMELVEGPSLAELLRRGSLDVQRALRLGRQVAEGLAEAHAKGILHRDLKAENVVVAAADHAKILDFGVAKTLRREEDATIEPTLSVEGQAIGTYRVMSPEQARGYVRSIGPASDLFALGTLFHEMLTGENPFLDDEGPAATLTRVCTYQPPPLAELRSDVPAELSCLVERLLEKLPQDRPPSAASAAEALAMIAAASAPRQPAGAAEPGDPATLEETIDDSAVVNSVVAPDPGGETTLDRPLSLLEASADETTTDRPSPFATPRPRRGRG